MADTMLLDAYNCVAKTKASFLPEIVDILNTYLMQSNIKLTTEKRLVECLEIIRDYSNDFGDKVRFDNGFMEDYKSDSTVLATGEELKDSLYINMYSRLAKIINTNKDYMNCENICNIIPDFDEIFRPTTIYCNTVWNSCNKADLPKVGVPVLVAITNGCVGIDWVNEPGSITPFAHYNVVGWLPLIGEHFEIKKKEVVL